MMKTSKAIAMKEAAISKGIAKNRVFDWDKAAKIIVDRGIQNAEAGLEGDMEYTGGTILEDGAPVPEERTYTYLASCWATPILVADGETIECWVEQKGSGWNAHTYWPRSARKILKCEGPTDESKKEH